VKTVRLKAVLRRIEQGWSPQCENRPAEDDEWGVLKVGCVNGQQFIAIENKALPPGLCPISGLEVHTGDILVSRANTRELVGGVAAVGVVRPHLLLCDKLYRLSVNKNLIVPRFLVYALKSIEARAWIEAEATGASSSMKNISQESLGSVPIYLWPISMQDHIVAFLDRETAKIDALITKQTEFLNCLMNIAVRW
jgi:type I restriction enzyme S subunit